MTDITIDEFAIMEMGRDWDSPCGQIIIAATEYVVTEQRAAAPVSPVGSRYAPPGFLKTHVHAAEPVHFDAEGRIMGLAGVSVNRSGGAWPYPLRFVSMDSGRIRNPGYYSRKKHQFTGKPPTYRRAANYFIEESLNSLASFYYEARLCPYWARLSSGSPRTCPGSAPS